MYVAAVHRPRRTRRPPAVRRPLARPRVAVQPPRERGGRKAGSSSSNPTEDGNSRPCSSSDRQRARAVPPLAAGRVAEHQLAGDPVVQRLVHRVPGADRQQQTGTGLSSRDRRSASRSAQARMASTDIPAPARPTDQPAGRDAPYTAAIESTAPRVRVVPAPSRPTTFSSWSAGPRSAGRSEPSMRDRCLDPPEPAPSARQSPVAARRRAARARRPVAGRGRRCPPGQRAGQPRRCRYRTRPPTTLRNRPRSQCHQVGFVEVCGPADRAASRTSTHGDGKERSATICRGSRRIVPSCRSHTPGLPGRSR
jgi:hypothetical protein